MPEPKQPNTNRQNDIETVLLHLNTQPEALKHARIVGRWIWIEFPSRPAKELCTWLTAEGFWFNRKRSAWQHGCGTYSSPARSHDPRQQYGSIPAADVLRDAQQVTAS